MASIFPSLVDNFANPVYTKIDGEDVVSAAHVNDLQDAVRAIEEVVAGAGKPLDFSSNNFIADDSSFKAALEALDGAIGTVNGDLAQHIAYVLVTDPAQHHANVVEVTPIGNLSSDKVQTALEEHQLDINAIMSGSTVEGVTLDNRYVKKTGAQSMQGPLTVTTDIVVTDNIAANSLDLTTNLTVGGTLDVTGITTLSDNLLVQVGKKIAEEGATSSSYILFGSDKLELYSHKDVVIRLDSDDATDGFADAGTFQVRNGLNSLVASVDEVGNITSIADISSVNLAASTSATIGTLVLTDTKADLGSEKLHIQLDKTNTNAAARFVVTMDGDTGNNLASADLLMNLDENSMLTTGIHRLKSGVQETGYFGLKVMSANAGGVFFGAGINFKHQLTNSPSSITLTPDGGSFNYSSLSVTDLNQYGCFFEFQTPAAGAAHVFGTYVTIGN